MKLNKFIAPAVPIRLRHAEALESEYLLSLSAGRHLHRDFALDGRDLDVSSQAQERKIDLRMNVEVIALPLEYRVLLDVKNDVEIARYRRTRPLGALTPHLQAGARVHSRRNVHLYRLLCPYEPSSLAGLAGVLYYVSFALTLFAGPVDAEKSLGVADLSPAMARRARKGLITRLYPGASTGGTPLLPGYLYLFLDAEDRFFELDLKVVPEVLALATPPLLRCPEEIAEEVAEDIVEVPPETEVDEGALFGRAVTVKPCPFLRIPEDLVGLVYLLEFL